MFGSFKWAALALTSLALSPIGALFALYFTGTHFSVSSGIGTLALFGVAVETGVIMIEYINQLRARGYSVNDAAVEGAVLRLRPIMMTMLVATLGLLPAAISTGIGSDSQKPFAMVIVGGLSATLLLSVYVLPTVYTDRKGGRCAPCLRTGSGRTAIDPEDRQTRVIRRVRDVFRVQSR